MKVRLTALFTGLLWFCCTFATQAQTTEKAWLYDQAKSLLQKKLKTSPEAMAHLEVLFQENGSTPAESALIGLRNDEFNLSVSEEPESEIHAAVNPTDTNNIIVAAMKLDATQLLNSLSFPIYYTKNFGQTWQLSNYDGVSDLPAFSFVLGGGDPVIAFDNTGKAYLSWLTFTFNINLTVTISINWATSIDGGANWVKQPNPIDAGSVIDLSNPDSRFVDKQWMATDLSESIYQNNLYTAYVEINLSDTTYNILVKTKTANGSDFGNAVQVSPPNLLIAQFASIDVDSEGKVHVIFAGADSPSAPWSLYHSVSGDGGQSFSTPVEIASMHLPCYPPGFGGPCDVVGIDSARVYPCPHIVVDKSGGAYNGNLYVAWTADGFQTELSSGLDIYFSKSENGGQTWSTPQVLNDDNNPATEQYYSSLSVNQNGVLVLSWYDRREDNANQDTKYYMTYSLDGGENFEPNFPLSTQSADFGLIGGANGNFGIGEYTQVVTTSGYAIPFWADGRDNNGNIDVFTSFIPIEGGAPVSIPEITTINPAFAIQQLHPNPAVNRTQLLFKLTKPAEVRLSLWHADGQLIKSHDYGLFPAGQHAIGYDLSAFPSGSYWIKIDTDFGFASRKLVIVE
ncbi:MAG TPA: T9SS type A sorting domain-containing protein [Saprospiraceae bacterium]|nr:T9SS type A sorting domain-containing protein [Saprospiraceae bacterium]HMQ84280.1 T9SS type A sorting domain-containing protein [Saprospiraceae bacterium]